GPGQRVRRLASLQQRLLVLRTGRQLLGLLRSLGLGAVPLRPLGLRGRTRLVLGPRRRLLGRVGLLVLRAELLRLVPARLLGLSLRAALRVRRLRLPLLEFRRVPQH